jgi:uncharacterized membrane protein
MKKDNNNNFRRIDLLILGLILFVALIFRLYKINTPLADLHSWRQVDTAAVARNFVRDGFDLLHPRYDDLSSIETGKENPQGYRFVEFPLYNAIFAFVYKALPVLPIEVYGRLTSVFFSLIIIAIIYFLCLKESNRTTAVIASLTYGIMPFFVFFSRTVLPETTALAFALISLFLLYLWLFAKRTWASALSLIFSAVSFAVALLVKPTVIFYGLPLMIIFLQRYQIGFIKKPIIYIYFILSFVPFIWWRNYIQQYPEGIPASTWLITNVNTFEGQKNIFFRPAFFRWIFYERLNNLILGGYLNFLFILGVISKTKKYLFGAVLLAAFSYLLTFQGGNVQHEYYQTLILPAIAIFIGLGVNSLIKNSRNYFVIPTIFIVALTFIFSFFFSYYNVRNYYNYPNDLIQMARIINALTDAKDKIITDRSGDTTLLYLADRKGSPANYKSLDDFKRDGYRYFISANQGTIETTKKEMKYQIVFDNGQFTLFKL